MSNFEHRITEDSTEFEKAFLKIYDGSLWTALDKVKDWQPPKPLVVVPQIMADFIEEWKEEFKLYDAFFEIAEGYGPGTKLYDWLFQKSNSQDLFARAWLDGYTVEKEELYYLREKNTGYYLTKKGDTLKLVVNPYFDETNEFAQEEIDKLNIGSYEQIPVEMSDNGI